MVPNLDLKRSTLSDMDAELADGERPKRRQGSPSRIPSEILWSGFLLLPVLSLVLGLYFEVGTPSKQFQGRLQRVLDGDTVLVWEGIYARKLRLAHVDCPERIQPFGLKATAFLEKLLGGQSLAVTITSTDKYGRLVAEIALPDGRWVHEELLRKGQAWFNHRYSQKVELKALEDEAKSQDLGLWQAENPEPPWEFRRNTR